MFTKASSLTLTGEIMGSDSIFFLDSQIIQNPELSDKANKFIRFFLWESPGLLSVLLICGMMKIKS